MKRVLKTGISRLFRSQSSLKVGRDAISAIWAQAIFNQICLAKYNQQPATLMDQLKSYQLSSQRLSTLEKLVDDPANIRKAREDIMGIFDLFQGLALPKPIMNSLDPFTDQLNLQGQITFYPLSFTAPTIFENVEEKFIPNVSSCRNILIEKAGFSNSAHLLLSWHLSSISSKFRFNDPTFAYKLSKKKLLAKTFPKILYINFRNRNPSLSQFIQLLKCQCPEAHSQLQEFSAKPEIGLYDFLWSLKNLYKQRNMQCLAIMDGVNGLAKRFNECNRIMKKQDQKLPLTEEEVKIKEQTRAQWYCYQCLQGIYPTLFNSSNKINQSLLSKPQKKDHLYYTLDVNNKKPITKIESYHQIAGSVRIKQLYRLIWYSSSKFLTPIQGKFLESYLIKACDEVAAKTKNVSSSMTPLNINRSLRANLESFHRILAQKTKFEKDFSQLIENYQRTEDFSQKIEEFVKKQYQIFSIPASKSDILSRLKNFLESQLPKSVGATGLQIYLQQKILRFAESKLNSKDLPKQNQEILLVMKEFARDKLKQYNFHQADQKIYQTIKHFVEAEVEIENQQKLQQKKKKQQLKENYWRYISEKEKDRYNNLLENEFKFLKNSQNSVFMVERTLSLLKLKQNEKILDVERKIIISRFKNFLEKKFSSQLRQADQQIPPKLEEFVENELNFKSFPRKIEALKLRMIQFVEIELNQKDLLIPQDKARRISEFVQNQLKLQNLPCLQQKIQSRIKNFMNQIKESIEKIDKKQEEENKLQQFKEEKKQKDICTLDTKQSANQLNQKQQLPQQSSKILPLLNKVKQLEKPSSKGTDKEKELL